MKKLFILVIAFAIGGAVMAQEKAKPVSKAVKEEAVKSDVAVKEEGVAKEHHSKYECPKCHATADKPGKCGHCKEEMKEAKAEMKKEKAEHKEEMKQHGEGHGHEKKAEEKK